MTLFDFAARSMSHANDPETSRIAAEQHVRSGKRAHHAAIVLALVQRHPGSTAIELWDHATDAERATLKEAQEIRRRLCNLETDGAVRKGVSRACTVRGSKQVTWEATNNKGV